MLSSRAIAVQGIGYSPALVALQGFLAVSDATHVQYGGWFSHPFIRDRKRRTHDDVRREREKLGIIAPPEVEKATEKAVTAVLEARTVPDVSTDLQAAEMELRAALSQLGQEMRQEYLTLLALEYARQEIEIEEAQIVMLLFDM